MDFSSISTAIASLKTAQEIAVSALSVRDFNQSAAAIAQINEKLLAAQQGLLAHNTMLLQLQSEYFNATEELRKLKESIAKKDSYPLVDLGMGALAYAVHVDTAGHGDPKVAEPQHYICQICWDRDGVRSVLQRPARYNSELRRVCNNCGKELLIGTRAPGNDATAQAGTIYNPLP
ncbi:hypothetical protein [Stenotrophomonas sp.]|uniref:hypothetical protein n=1 Tax=Stenotrophomonas sp. TaxID=69392 RepID=UPI0028A988C2|nr:hypothetical protein [Stenotrophomonas sp.]